MKTAAKICFVAMAVVAMTTGGAIGASTSDNFDSYTAGTHIEAQADWMLWANDPGDASNGGALITNAFSNSAPNSLQMSGVDSVPGLNSDVTWQFGPITSGVVTLTAQVYIPGNAVLGEQAMPLLAQHPGDGTYNTPTGINWASNGLSFQLNSEGDTVNGDSGVTFVRDAWKEIKFVADVDNKLVSAYYDGNAVFTDATWGGPAQVEAIDFWSNNGGDGCSPIYVDDLSVTVVPEPTSMAMLLSFGLGILLCIRRRR